MGSDRQQEEIANYAAAVRGELSDLPAAERDILLEDLEQHLAEVVEESGPSLEARLGTPEGYAAELRTAYGTHAISAPQAFARSRRVLARATTSVTSSGTYRAFRGYLPELRPAWWVLRAYLVVMTLAILARGDGDVHPVPNPLSGRGLLEILAIGLAIVLSVRLGRWSASHAGRSTWPLRGANAAVAVVGLAFLNMMGTLPVWFGTVSQMPDQLGGFPNAYAVAPLTNIYPYGADGKPLDGVFLFDQDGRPLTVGSKGYDLITQYPAAADGQPITNQYPLKETHADGSAVTRPRVALPPSATPSPSATP